MFHDLNLRSSGRQFVTSLYRSGRFRAGAPKLLHVTVYIDKTPFCEITKKEMHMQTLSHAVRVFCLLTVLLIYCNAVGLFACCKQCK